MVLKILTLMVTTLLTSKTLNKKIIIGHQGWKQDKNIRSVDCDHDIDCKIDGQSMLLKSKFITKLTTN